MSSAGPLLPFPSIGSFEKGKTGTKTQTNNAPGGVGTPARAFPRYSTLFDDSIVSPRGPSSEFLGGILSSAIMASTPPIAHGS